MLILKYSDRLNVFNKETEIFDGCTSLYVLLKSKILEKKNTRTITAVIREEIKITKINWFILLHLEIIEFLEYHTKR